MSSVRHLARLATLLVLSACGGESNSTVQGGAGGVGGTGAGASGSSGDLSGGTSGVTGGQTPAPAGGTGNAGMTGVGGAGTGNGAGAASEPTEVQVGINGLSHGEPGFVATGAESTTGTLDSFGVIYHSEDGIDWTRVVSDLPVIPWDVEYGNGRFVALGHDIRNINGTFIQSASAYVSEDGVEWEPASVPTSDVSTGMAFGNGLFVGASSVGALSSPDGVMWTLDGQAGYGSGVEFAGGTFVSWSYGRTTVAVSTGTDGWTSVALDGYYGVTAVNALNDGFVGMSRHDVYASDLPMSTYRRIASEDGHVWTSANESLSTEPPLVFVNDGSVCIALEPAQVWSGPTCDALEVTFRDDLFRPWTAKSLGGLYFVAGARGIVSSPDGVNWTPVLSDH